MTAAGELLEALCEKVEDDDEYDDDDDMDDDYNRLCNFAHGVFAEALREVGNAGIFGDEVTLSILMGDQGDDERLENAVLLMDKF